MVYKPGDNKKKSIEEGRASRRLYKKIQLKYLEKLFMDSELAS